MAASILYHAANWVMSRLPSRIKRPIKLKYMAHLPKPQYYLISYPKSGRTWLRLMLGSAAADHFSLPIADHTDLCFIAWKAPKFPTITVSHDLMDLAESYRTEGSFHFRRELYCKSKVILLIRDPRDVLASFYYHQKKRQHLTDFASPDEMICAPVGGLKSIITFYNMWIDHLSETAGHVIVFYEELKLQPAAELRKCFEFLGIPEISEVSIDRAIQAGQFKRMQAMERQGEFQHDRLRPADPNDVSSFKVRRGVVGGYLQDFSPKAIAAMDDLICANLTEALAVYKYKTAEALAKASH